MVEKVSNEKNTALEKSKTTGSWRNIIPVASHVQERKTRKLYLEREGLRLHNKNNTEQKSETCLLRGRTKAPEMFARNVRSTPKK